MRVRTRVNPSLQNVSTTCGVVTACAHQDGDQAHVFNEEHAKNGRSLNKVKLNRITVDTGSRWHIVNERLKALRDQT